MDDVDVRLLRDFLVFDVHEHDALFLCQIVDRDGGKLNQIELILLVSAHCRPDVLDPVVRAAEQHLDFLALENDRFELLIDLLPVEDDVRDVFAFVVVQLLDLFVFQVGVQVEVNLDDFALAFVQYVLHLPQVLYRLVAFVLSHEADVGHVVELTFAAHVRHIVDEELAAIDLPDRLLVLQTVEVEDGAWIFFEAEHGKGTKIVAARVEQGRWGLLEDLFLALDVLVYHEFVQVRRLRDLVPLHIVFEELGAGGPGSMMRDNAQAQLRLALALLELRRSQTFTFFAEEEDLIVIRLEQESLVVQFLAAVEEGDYFWG